MRMSQPDESPSAAEEPRQGPDQAPAREEVEAVDDRIGDQRWLAEQTLMLDKRGPQVLHMIADTLRENGDLETAERFSRKAIHLAENHGQEPTALCSIYVGLAKCLHRQDKLNEAEQWLRKAYDLADGMPLGVMICWSIASHLQDTLEVQGKRDEVEEWKEKASVLVDGLIEQQKGRAGHE